MRFLLVVVGGLCGCALFSKSPPLETRYFSPEPAADAAAPQDPRVAWPAGQRPRVRLGRVSPSSYLRKRIVHRTSPVEIGLYETRWWTEDPDAYVRRALERALYEEHGLEQATGGAVITLDVDVIAFEELVSPRHAGRVQLRYRLRDEHTVVDSGVITVEHPVAGPDFDAVVAAIGAAMGEASSRLAERVVPRLGPGGPGQETPAGVMTGGGGL